MIPHHFYPPPPALSGVITAFWLHQSKPQARSRVLPTGTAQLIIDLSGDGLCVPDFTTTSRSRDTFSTLLHGADTTFFPLETDRPLYQFGVDFTPGGIYPFFAPPASELQNAHVPLDTLWGAEASAELHERLAEAHTAEDRLQIFERMLLRQQVRPLQHHPAVGLALHAFSVMPQERAAVRIAQVAEEAGISRGHLTRIFCEEVGLTPKQYVRVRRFRTTLRRIRKEQQEQRMNWARLAVECGYYDQAHLINDFQTFAGVCPSVYLRNRNAQSPATLSLIG